jgi:DNA invertase Pin-like site-specific DNA recombinase
VTVYGYGRVSTDGQSLCAQLAELKAAKCAKIFQEKLSGARTGEERERADELLRVDESARSELTWLDEQEPEEIKRHRDVEVRKGDSEARS